MKIVLASISPRRKELLSLLIKDFLVHPANADESLPENIAPTTAVENLAKLKSENVSILYPEDLIIGSDTVVELNGVILGKPTDFNDAVRMLTMLSGKTHNVHTGVALTKNGETKSFVSTTKVTFCELSPQEIKDYVNTKDPFDKAGGYGIQGFGARFVKSIEGDYYTVMGLPVNMLYRKLEEMGIPCFFPDFNI